MACRGPGLMTAGRAPSPLSGNPFGLALDPDRAAMAVGLWDGAEDPRLAALRALGGRVEQRSDLGAALAELGAQPDLWWICAVHVPRTASLEAATEALVTFRRASPTIAVLLVAGELTQDSFALGQLDVADVLLRDTADIASFDFGLAVAPINNQVWRQRLRDAAPDQRSPSERP